MMSYSQNNFKLKKYSSNLTFKPTIHAVVTPGISNSNSLSNEDSTNNDFNIDNFYRQNRFSGNDKMDNSKRIGYGLSAYTSNFKSNLFQTYEFTNNSNFHKEQGNDHNFSDLLGLSLIHI